MFFANMMAGLGGVFAVAALPLSFFSATYGSFYLAAAVWLAAIVAAVLFGIAVKARSN